MPAPRFAFLLLALTAACGRAQTTIRHCVGADGHPVFTDQPCASLGAIPAPASSAPAPSMRPPATTCAADIDQLQRAVIDAFANADPNRLAGLVLWAGYGERAAVADIRAFADLMQQPLVDIAVSGDASDAAALAIHTITDDGLTRETRLDIARHAGCVWLRPPLP